MWGFGVFFVFCFCFVCFVFVFPLKFFKEREGMVLRGLEVFSVQHPGRLSASAEIHACEDVGILFIFHFLLP